MCRLDHRSHSRPYDDGQITTGIEAGQGRLAVATGIAVSIEHPIRGEGSFVCLGGLRQFRHALPCRDLEARAVIHSMQPIDKIGGCRSQRLPFRCSGQKVQMRRDE